MKILRVIGLLLIGLLAIVAIVGVIAYAAGSKLPADHTVSVTGTIDAPPARVFARIAEITDIPSWRHAVKSVKMLPPDGGRDHWIEDFGHGNIMTFLATHTDVPGPTSGIGRREVPLDVPGAAYGGTWTYELSPGPTPNTTTLKITEAGFIHPPIYRFMMLHVMGLSHNIDQYFADLRDVAPRL